MSNNFTHIPVLFKEIETLILSMKTSKNLKNESFNSIVDCTFGAGGHGRMFAKYAPVIAFERDENYKNLHDDIESIKIHYKCFSTIENSVKKTDLIFADLGLSSMQLDDARGFSFMRDSDLNMYMGGEEKKSLKHILKYMPIYKIQEIIKKYGEEKEAAKIANNIDRYRLKGDITTTFELRKAIGNDKFPVLARVFQAFRIFINNEMEELENLLKSIPSLTDTALIISFHSLEDRLIKHSFKKFKYSGFILPSSEEVILNPKSRTAKLRFGSNIYDFSKIKFISD